MTEQYFFGVDIGGTKIATSAGRQAAGVIEVMDRKAFPTIQGDPTANIARIVEYLQQLKTKHGCPAGIGISCGGPLDIDAGEILSPPNLPGWDRVPIVRILQEQLEAPVYMENDANACALAEFHYGAGKGTTNMVFLTFGTGMGAGIVLGGKLYRGSTGGAGEVGHIRLAEDGPVGYGKRGSFEGFCSGSGLAQLGRMIIERHIAQGDASAWALENAGNTGLTAKRIASAAVHGDPAALEIMEVCGAYLGRGLSVLVDILNPDVIVIGSIFERSGDLLIPSMEKALREEALECNLRACRVMPSRLRDALGDYAALSIASEWSVNDKLEMGEKRYG